MAHVRSAKVLLELDEGLMSLIEAERRQASTTRTQVMRALLTEALEARAESRGEEIPTAEPWAPGEQTDPNGTILPEAPCVQASRETQGPVGKTKLERLFDEILPADASYALRSTGIIRADVLGDTRALIRPRPVRMAHDSLAAEPQTPGEERITKLGEKR